MPHNFRANFILGLQCPDQTINLPDKLWLIVDERVDIYQPIRTRQCYMLATWVEGQVLDRLRLLSQRHYRARVIRPDDLDNQFVTRNSTPLPIGGQSNISNWERTTSEVFLVGHCIERELADVSIFGTNDEEFILEIQLADGQVFNQHTNS
jgi:hypothetical protein